MKTHRAMALVMGVFVGTLAPGKEFMAMAPAEFARQAGLGARLTVDTLDRPLLAAAIFHETNRVRRLAGLPALRWLEKLNQAADIQSRVGMIFPPPSHTNPFAAISSPLERVKYVGLVPNHVAENIALIPVYDLGSRSDFGVKRRQEKTIFVDMVTDRELSAHTYASYAALTVQSWLASPGHRKNLLDPSIQFLGCSVCPKRGVFGEEMVFSVQVFFAPRGKKLLAVPGPDLSSGDIGLSQKLGG